MADTRERSSKRRARDGSEDVLPRKKQHRQVVARQNNSESEDNGSDGDQVSSKAVRGSKNKSAPRNEKEYPSINELKSRIRGVKRLLNKDLPADARIVQERALAGYEQDLVEETARRERSNMIKKYHFVRFLDRKTATKQLNRLQRREKEKDLTTEQKSELSQKIHDARVNLNYTIYYPLTEKYISLYPKSDSNPDEKSGPGAESKENNKTAEASKPPMWSFIEKSMEEGTLDDLREGKLNIGPDGQQTSAPTKKPIARESEKKAKEKTHKESKEAAKKEKLAQESALDRLNRRERRKEQQKARELAAQQAAEGDSDGGFFEM
ncbi:rRNA-processing protein efg1 [Penicillium cataractarum]|uniref:rRNA-processing protein EFG1 n=1 Tax=Penicillium cataractarum TaxID=2100454 RepID=A0A9W9VVF9_9EURO|nr:rRNA-processing protein efg1 [Penicillium cataractarum]KAJ5389904.1 rRNA-processing protein efg1 [Penicillium cataractarum]